MYEELEIPPDLRCSARRGRADPSRELSGSTASEALGLPLLVESADPLSRLFHIPTLIGAADPVPPSPPRLAGRPQAGDP